MTTPFNPFGLPEIGQAWVINATTGAASQGINAAGQAFIQGLAGTGTAPVLAAGAGAGTSPTLASQKGHDLGGSLLLTIGSTPGAGALVTVTFGTALSVAPAYVSCAGWDQTAAAGVAVGPTSIATTGFTISGPSITAAHVVYLTWLVLYA